MALMLTSYRSCLLAVAVFSASCVSAVRAHPLDLSERPRNSRNSLTGQFIWELQLSNGMSARWETVDGRSGAVQEGESTWFRNAKALGSRHLEMTVASYGLLVEVERSDDEKQAASMAQDNVPGLEAVQEKYNALLDRFTAECQNLPQQRQAVCSKKFDVPIEELTKTMYQLQDAAKAKADKIGALCTILKLKVRDGIVSGKADYCAGEPNVAVTGSVRPVGVR